MISAGQSSSQRFRSDIGISLLPIFPILNVFFFFLYNLHNYHFSSVLFYFFFRASWDCFQGRRARSSLYLKYHFQFYFSFALRWGKKKQQPVLLVNEAANNLVWGHWIFEEMCFYNSENWTFGVLALATRAWGRNFLIALFMKIRGKWVGFYSCSSTMKNTGLHRVRLLWFIPLWTVAYLCWDLGFGIEQVG